MDALIRRYRKLIDATNTSKRRFLYDEIDWSQPLIGIMGQRGVGKTTLMLQRIKLEFPDTSKAFFASLDSIWFGQHTLLDLADYLIEQFGITHLFLDGVHRMPGWQQQVKNLYDLYPELHVVFTSSSLLVMNYSMGDLSRRVSMYHLPGLSFREFLMFEGEPVFDKLSLSDILYSHQKISQQLTEEKNMLSLFHKYMKVGYYPFYGTMKRDDFYNRLYQILTAVIESDIPVVENKIEYETLIKAKRLVGIVSGTLPYQPNLSTLSGIMGTNRAQLLRLFDLLERGGIFRQLFNKTNSPKALGKAQKVLLNNSALMYSLQDPNIGAVRETVFAQMLVGHKLNYAKVGDFLVDGRYIFEIGGKGKGFAQIRNLPDSFVVADDISVGIENKIPLWLFGFLY